MVHLKRTTSTTHPRTGITTYTTIIPKAPYHSAPSGLRRAFRHEIIDDQFPNVSQHHKWHETGGKARRINDWLDGESDGEHERGRARSRDGRIRRGSREKEEKEEAGEQDEEEDGGEEGEEEEEQHEKQIQDELELQVRRESSVGGEMMEEVTYDATNTPEFLVRMTQHTSTSPPIIPAFSAGSSTLAHVRGRTAQIARGIRARGGRGRGRTRNLEASETTSQTDGAPYNTPRGRRWYSKEEDANEQNSSEFLATVARHSNEQASLSLIDRGGRGINQRVRGGRERGRGRARQSSAFPALTAETASAPRERARGRWRVRQSGRRRTSGVQLVRGRGRGRSAFPAVTQAVATGRASSGRVARGVRVRGGRRTSRGRGMIEFRAEAEADEEEMGDE